MEIKTRDFGKVKIAKDEIITFPHGIPGFLNNREFVLLKISNENPFLILQSMEDEELAFITISPWDVKKDYEFEIDSKIKSLLQITSHDDIIVLVIGIFKRESGLSVNLNAPLVVNYKARLGKQVILDNPVYAVRYSVYEENKRQEA